MLELYNTMDALQVVFLSVIEGVTEFLPVSSTGHLILATKLLGITPTSFTKSFEIAIQLGAIASVVFLYAKSLIINKKLILVTLTAFFPTAVIGFLAYPLVKEVFLESTTITLASLFIGGLALIIIEKLCKYRDYPTSINKIGFKQAFAIGLVQSISIIPGVSRAAATIFGGLFAGLTRQAAVEFSFLLAIPTMLAATALDLYKSAGQFSQANFLQLTLGFVVSFFVALVSVKFLLAFIKKNNFVAFGVYRIILSLLFLLFIL